MILRGLAGLSVGRLSKTSCSRLALMWMQTLGQAATGATAESVTAAGLAVIQTIPGLSQNDDRIINNSSIWPIAPSPDGAFSNVTGSDGVTSQVEMGNIVGSAPDYLKPARLAVQH